MALVTVAMYLKNRFESFIVYVIEMYQKNNWMEILDFNRRNKKDGKLYKGVIIW